MKKKFFTKESSRCLVVESLGAQCEQDGAEHTALGGSSVVSNNLLREFGSQAQRVKFSNHFHE